ncbi:GreA/GreB family elongation factor [Salinimicrobium tongyeongense]|uniref:GreA/GreB family elongation factor n=1 Tax=Salinimicrobium tongyeongense TaxID=2809707 RepID=A0ABY6NPW5_9FLAO|nr:GreA/GreB family elongation factor [Salinimicrobium tongyeongense]UZH54955.1 GreA/GreB family elongation factor [Salinimicrobium tongyeongense]
MKYSHIIIEKKEFELLKNLISTESYYKDKAYKSSLNKLKKELEDVKIVDNNQMPEDVIRINSLVTIQSPWNVTRTYQIVVPEQSDIRNNKISVVAPMGLALIGYAQGDEVEWEFPMGTKTIQILEVEQTGKKLKLEEL